MGFGDLGRLFKKDYRIFLILIIWLLIGFTLFQFDIFLFRAGETDITLGYIVFLPLIVFSIALVLIALFTKKDLTELSSKQAIIYSLIALLIMVFFSGFILILFYIAILSWIFITSLFSMWGCYERGVEYDEKIYNWPKPINFFARWIQFFFFNTIAVILVAIAASAGTYWALVSVEIAGLYLFVGWSLLLVMVFLTLIGFLFVLIARLNAWLSVFHLWVALYTFYLMLNAFYRLSDSSGGGPESSIYIQLGLYIFDVLLLLYTIGGIVGKKADSLSSALPMKPETILIWLIFSKAAFEFADALPSASAGILKAALSFLLFVPMVFIIGLYGIFRYGKTKKERKVKKKKKKTAKKLGMTLEEFELKEAGQEKCKKCGAPNKKGATFCKACGKEQTGLVKGNKCKKCGALNKKDAKFCKGCGKEL